MTELAELEKLEELEELTGTGGISFRTKVLLLHFVHQFNAR